MTQSRCRHRSRAAPGEPWLTLKDGLADWTGPDGQAETRHDTTAARVVPTRTDPGEGKGGLVDGVSGLGWRFLQLHPRLLTFCFFVRDEISDLSTGDK